MLGKCWNYNQIQKLQDSKTKNKMTNPNAEAQKEIIQFEDFTKKRNLCIS